MVLEEEALAALRVEAVNQGRSIRGMYAVCMLYRGDKQEERMDINRYLGSEVLKEATGDWPLERREGHAFSTPHPITPTSSNNVTLST